MGFANWKIGYRLAAGLGLAIIFMIGIAFEGIGSLSRLNANTSNLANDKVPR